MFSDGSRTSVRGFLCASNKWKKNAFTRKFQKFLGFFRQIVVFKARKLGLYTVWSAELYIKTETRRRGLKPRPPSTTTDSTFLGISTFWTRIVDIFLTWWRTSKTQSDRPEMAKLKKWFCPHNNSRWCDVCVDLILYSAALFKIRRKSRKLISTLSEYNVTLPAG